MDPLCERLGRLLSCRCRGRISPSVRRVPQCFSKGCHDRQCRRDPWAANRGGFREEAFNKAQKNRPGRKCVVVTSKTPLPSLLAFFGELMK
jgi:hypothetical protein